MSLTFGPRSDVSAGQVGFGGADENGDTIANVQPRTTTITHNEDGTKDVTHKVTFSPDTAGAINTMVSQTPVPAAPPTGQLGSGTFGAVAPAMPQMPQTPQVNTFGQTPAPAAPPAVPQMGQMGSGTYGIEPTVGTMSSLAPETPVATAPTPEEQQQQMRDTHSEILNNNTDPQVAIQNATNPDLPKDIQHSYALQIADLTRYNLDKQRAEDQVKTMDSKQIADTLRREHPEGSWARYIITGMLGLTGLNQMEANKLGLSDKTIPVRDPATGASGMIRVSHDGTPLQGINSDGTAMTQRELTNFYAEASQKKVAAAKAGAEYLGPNGEKGRLVTRNLPDGSTDTYIEHGGKRITGEAAQAWTPMSVENAAAKAEKQTTEQGKRAEKTTTETGIRKETGAQIQLRYTAPIAYNKAAAASAGKFNQENDTNVAIKQIGGRTHLVDQNNGDQIIKPGIDGTINAVKNSGTTGTAPGINVPPPAAPAGAGAGAGPLPPGMNPAAAMPTGVPAAATENPLVAGKPRFGDPGIRTQADLKIATKQWEENNKITQDAQKEVAKVAAKDITAKLNQAQALQAEVQNAHTWLDSGKTYFGGGANTIARTYYRHMPLVEQDEEMANTNRIMTLTKQENLQNLASMIKGSFSDKDMTYINQHTITENTNPKEVKKWLDHYNQVTIKAYNNQAAALKNPAAAGEALTVQNTALQTKTVDGKNYIFDGKGWKLQ